MALGKKGAVQIVWIVLALIGVILSVKYGPTLIQSVSLPSGITISNYANYFYYPGQTNPDFPCDSIPHVIFRSAIPLTSISNENDVPSGTIMAYDPTPNDNNNNLNLVKNLGGSYQQSGQCPTPLITISSNVFIITGPYLCINRLDMSNKYDRLGLPSISSGISTSTIPGTTSNEVLANEPQQMFKYVCEGNQIRNKACNSYLNTYQNIEGTSQNYLDCPLGCEFHQELISGVTQSGVKCAGNYQPNKQWCDGNTKYSTTSTGSLQSEPCVQCRQVGENAFCDPCVVNTQGCVDSNGDQGGDIPATCQLQTGSTTHYVPKMSGSLVGPSGDCIGNSFCSVSGGVATCTQYCAVGQKDCDSGYVRTCDYANQAMVRAQEPCDNGCNNGACNPFFPQGAGYYCDVSGTGLEGCSGDCLDSEDVIQPILCQSGTCVENCEPNNAKCLPVCSTSLDYCDSTSGDVFSCLLDSTNIAGGGYKISTTPKSDCDAILKCAGGEITSTACTYDSNCIWQGCTGTQAYCKTTNDCSPLSSVVCQGAHKYQCDQFGKWGSDLGLCDGGCIGGECQYVYASGPGTFCDNGKIVTCSGDCLDTEDKTQITCEKGTCNSNTAQCDPICPAIGNKYCGKNLGKLDESLYLCNGITNAVTGDRALSLDTPCTFGCDETNNRCNPDPLCSGYENSIRCYNGRSVTCDSNGVLTRDKNCGSAGCDELTGDCEIQCTGQKYCKDGIAIYSCVGNVFTDVLTTCNNLGCYGDSAPECNDKPCVGTNICEGDDSYQCENVVVPDSNGYQVITKSGTASYCDTGCNPLTGLCSAQCTGTRDCYLGKMYNCNEGVRGTVITGCNELGCNPSTKKCNDASGCTQEFLTRCTSDIQDMETCTKTTDNQLVWTKSTCGSQGCDSTTNKCKSLQPNSYICQGQSLYKTDAQGFLPSTPIKVCGSEQLRNGLQPYCVNGKNDCVVCALNSYIAGTNTLGQCSDEFTGAMTNVQTCEAGVVDLDTSSATNYKCDQLQAVISPTQNFKPNEAINVKGSIKGSASGQPINDSPFTATLVGEGKSLSSPGYTDTNGAFTTSFGSLDLGKYNVTITFTNFVNKAFSVASAVTNSYIITKEEKDIIVKLPGEVPYFTVTAKDSSGKAPDNLVLSTYPPNITVAVNPTDVETKWKVTIDGPTGTYTIGLKPLVGDTQLDEQTFKIGISVPKLTAEVTMPSSEKPGEHTYDVRIKGASQLVEPDSEPTAKMYYNGVPSSVDLQSMGGGSYLFTYNFNGIGTYTLQVSAQKEGYDTLTNYQKKMYVSPSGTESEPLTTTGNQTGGGDQPPTIPTDYTWLYYIVGAGLLYYLIWGRKKR